MTATVMGETIAAGMSPALALSLPRKEGTYPLTFFPSLLSREGLALPDCVFDAFVLLIRRKVVRSRRKDVWLELEEEFVRSEFWKGEVQDYIWYAEQ